MVLLLHVLAAIGCAQAATVSGTVRYDRGPAGPPAGSEVAVALIRLETREDGSLKPLTKSAVQGAELSFGEVSPAAAEAVADGTLAYEVRDVARGAYAAVAYERPAKSSAWIDFSSPPQMGFHALPGCAMGAHSTVCSTPIIVKSSDVDGVGVAIRRLAALPARAEGGSATLATVDGGYVALHTVGKPWDRGYGHGLLLARQIVDFFEFFVLEDRVRGAPAEIEDKYTKISAALEKRVRVSPAFQAKAEGLLAGMRASGEDLTTSLGRDFEYKDVLAVNNYNDFVRILELDGADASALVAAALEDSCTQFVFYGNLTRGGTITGRNMDGENDVRKVTVSSLVLFADEPADPDERRVVHAMWPGFLGASSGFNEDGVYLMENAGCSPPPEALPRGATVPCERDAIVGLLQNAKKDGGLGRRPTADGAARALRDHWAASTSNGTCVSGCIFVMARPSAGDAGDAGPAAWIYEGDLNGGEIRVPNAPRVAPHQDEAIMASNHYWKYHTDPDRVANNGSAWCNGEGPATFSSLWRYEAGKNRVDAILRARAFEPSRPPIDADDLRVLLRTVSHGTSEHSIIFHPDRKVFEIAKARTDSPVWDAPDAAWTTFAFDDLFRI